MAWWEFLDDDNLYRTEGVLLWAGGAAVGLLLGGLGLAYLWHWWRDGQKRRRASPVASQKPKP